MFKAILIMSIISFIGGFMGLIPPDIAKENKFSFCISFLGLLGVAFSCIFMV